MTTVRLDTTTEATLKRLAARRGQTKSDVIRDAIAHLAEEEHTDSAYQQLRPFVGIADSGGKQLSQDTGRRFRELRRQKLGPRSRQTRRGRPIWPAVKAAFRAWRPVRDTP